MQNRRSWEGGSQSELEDVCRREVAIRSFIDAGLCTYAASRLCCQGTGAQPQLRLCKRSTIYLQSTTSKRMGQSGLQRIRVNMDVSTSSTRRMARPLCKNSVISGRRNCGRLRNRGHDRKAPEGAGVSRIRLRKSAFGRDGAASAVPG